MIIESAKAKINLWLSVGGRLPTGYHEIKSVICPISLADEVQIEKTNNQKIEVETQVSREVLDNMKASLDKDNEQLTRQSSNLNIAHKAASIFNQTFDIKQGYKILIQKNIPFQAGLGGGSADAAAVLRGLSKYFPKASKKKISEIASKLGSDVSAQYFNCPVFVMGQGEVVYPLSPSDVHNQCFLLVVKPDFGVSTKEAYEKLTRPGKKLITNTKPSYEDKQKIKSIGFSFVDNNYDYNNLDLIEVMKNCHNDFESVVCNHDQRYEKLFNMLYDSESVKCLLSGSGSSVVAFYNSKDKLNIAYNNLKLKFPKGYFICNSMLTC